MQIIYDLFYIILFVTVIGGAFTLLSLAADRVMGFTPPLWFSVCGMIAYIVPLLAPGLYLVPPKAHSWVPGYYVVCAVWFCGVILFTVYDIVRTVLAHRAIQNYRVCDDERIKAVFVRCAGLVRMKKIPLVCFGTLSDPACVAGVLHPTVILNEAMIRQLTDAELMAVLCHEVTHSKRGHIILGRIYDYICILHWLNPLVWIAKKEFAVHCELDCDRRTIACLENQLTDADYAGAMLRLLGLSSVQKRSKMCGMSALGFLVAKRRIELIMCKPTGVKKILVTCALVLLLAMVILFSITLSRGHFYPYPAYQTLPEYSCDFG